MKWMMQTKKVAASVAIASAMMATTMVPTSFAASKETLTLAFMGVYYPRPAINTVIKKFEQTYPQYNVKLDFITANGWGDYFNKIQTMISSGNAPDVANIASEGVHAFVDNGLALPIDQYMKSDPSALHNIKDYPPELRTAFEVGGQTYGIGTDWNNVVIHINTDMLKAAHLKMPSKNWTLNDFLKYAKAMTGTTNGKKHYGFAVPNYWFGTEAWLYNDGASILNNSMTKSTINSPRAVKLIQFFHDLIYKYHYAPVPGKIDSIQQLMSGQVGMIAAGRWPQGEYVPAKFKAVNVQFIPTMVKNQPEFGIASCLVMKSTKDALASYRLATFMGSPFAQNTLLSYTAIPSRLSVMKKQLHVGPIKNYKIYEQSAFGAKQVQAPKQYPALENIFNRAMSEIYSNQEPVKQALDQAAQQMDSALNGAP